MERSGTWGKAPPEIKALERRHMNQRQPCGSKTKKRSWLMCLHLPPRVHVASVAPPGLRPCGRRHPRFRSASHSSTWGYSWYCLAEANQRANPSVCLYAWASGDVSHNTHHYFPCTIQWKQLNACAASPGLICFALSALLLLRGNVNAAALMMVESTTRMLFIWRERGHLCAEARSCTFEQGCRHSCIDCRKCRSG